uniref:uncharacterized protein LOC105351702 n=1 Tax=Fragaria vesca subsp. vesca TaxID=101020 RepID=UPI0005C7F1BD|nr:PREDICTED: uncharacterized protein LOC105351702 [Fragaria vesca subsp. vesca]
MTYESMDDPHSKHTEFLKSGSVSKKDGMPEVCSLYTLLHEKQVLKLQESLPKLEPSLKKYGISYTLDKNSMVLSTTRGTKNPDIIDKAWQLLELLSTTHVPASMAIEVLDCMQTCLIKIGNQEGGLCSLYGIKEEDYSERWECLRHSLQIVAETVECSLFLNDNTFAAVGETSVGMIKQPVKNCIIHNVCPGTVARDHNWLSRGFISTEDPHVQHMETENSGSAMRVRPELTSLYTYFKMEQGTQVENDWKIVEECLKKHGFCCKLITEGNYCSMIVSRTTNTGGPDITNKIWDFLKLLSIDLEPSTAIEVLNGSMHYDFIPTGYEYGTLCSKFGVTEEQYAEVVWPHIQRGSESVASYLNCEFIIMVSNAVPDHSEGLHDFWHSLLKN